MKPGQDRSTLPSARRLLPVVILLCAFMSGISSAATKTYTYDSAGRLAKVDYGSNKGFRYRYDGNGNLISRQPLSAEPPARQRPAKRGGAAATIESSAEGTMRQADDVLSYEGTTFHSAPVGPDSPHEGSNDQPHQWNAGGGARLLAEPNPLILRRAPPETVPWDLADALAKPDRVELHDPVTSTDLNDSPHPSFDSDADLCRECELADAVGTSRGSEVGFDVLFGITDHPYETPNETPKSCRSCDYATEEYDYLQDILAGPVGPPLPSILSFDPITWRDDPVAPGTDDPVAPGATTLFSTSDGRTFTTHYNADTSLASRDNVPRAAEKFLPVSTATFRFPWQNRCDRYVDDDCDDPIDDPGTDDREKYGVRRFISIP